LRLLPVFDYLLVDPLEGEDLGECQDPPVQVSGTASFAVPFVVPVEGPLFFPDAEVIETAGRGGKGRNSGFASFLPPLSREEQPDQLERGLFDFSFGPGIDGLNVFGP
jgi:hypothetical protein